MSVRKVAHAVAMLVTVPVVIFPLEGWLSSMNGREIRARWERPRSAVVSFRRQACCGIDPLLPPPPCHLAGSPVAWSALAVVPSSFVFVTVTTWQPELTAPHMDCVTCEFSAVYRAPSSLPAFDQCITLTASPPLLLSCHWRAERYTLAMIGRATASCLSGGQGIARRRSPSPKVLSSYCSNVAYGARAKPGRDISIWRCSRGSTVGSRRYARPTARHSGGRRCVGAPLRLDDQSPCEGVGLERVGLQLRGRGQPSDHGRAPVDSARRAGNSRQRSLDIRRLCVALSLSTVSPVTAWAVECR